MIVEYLNILFADKEIYNLMEKEYNRQVNNLELIASENIVSDAVREAMGSHLTNKYAEGYPGKRYYGGCKYIDEIETLAQERVCKIFGTKYANVQPHSGSQANLAVYNAFLEPGDTVLGLSLQSGGHLTHGSTANASGKYYNFIPYGLDPVTERIDYDMIEKLAKEKHPKMIVAGASAYPRIIDFERISKIAHDNDALFMVDMAHIAGLVATGLHPSPVGYADVITSTTHKTLRGPRGGFILCDDPEYYKKINKSVFPETQGGPLEHIIAAKAVCFHEAMDEGFTVYQKQVVENAAALAAALKEQGLRLVTDGTDNHLVLIDLTTTNHTGKEVEKWLEEANISVNKNTIPNEKRSPSITSGIRVGTPAVTSRGLVEKDMEKIAEMIAKIAFEGESAIPVVKEEVKTLLKNVPLREYKY